MFKSLGYLPAGLLAIALSTASTACATQSGYQRYPGNTQRADNQAYDRGFAEGRRQGQYDAQARRSYDYGRHTEYREANSGYRYGDRSNYRQMYRDGFVAGYNEGYRYNSQNGSGGIFTPAPQSGRAVPRYPTTGRYESVAASN